MKKLLKQKLRKVLYYIHHAKHEKFYKLVMQMNGIKNCKARGEDKWIEKWSQLGVKASPSQYRVFSKYIGNNINIVPEDICHDFIEPVLNPLRFVGYYSDKNMFDKIFPSGYCPKTILRKIRGHWYSADYNELRLTDATFIQIMGGLSCQKLIIKPSVDGISGIGVRLYSRSVCGGGDRYLDSQNEELTFSVLNEKYCNDVIIQEAVEQDEYINMFNRTSVNTLRLSLYRSVIDDKPHITGAIMRIGSKGSCVDNAHAGGCYVGINKDGTFCHWVLDQYGRSQRVFNDVDFCNKYSYPNWKEVVEFGKSVARYVPHHRLLALDIALTKGQKPVLIEFNCMYYSTWLFQYTTSPAFGEYTDEIIDYCLSHKDMCEVQLLI